MPTPNPAPRRAPAAAALLIALAPAMTLAQQAGTDYRMLAPPQPTEHPGKIEVTEFFSFACPHCNEFYPHLQAWLATQAPDVVLRHVPVSFNRLPWVNLARAYYALQSLGLADRLEGPLFNAIHGKHEQLFDQQSIAEWVGNNGGDAEKFIAAYTSFAVNNQTVQADVMAETYQVAGVPTLAVDGRYVALGDSFPEILKNTDALVAKVRAERAAAARAPRKAK